MPAYAYRILNVFTEKDNRFSGNPLCVFEDGNSLDSTQMQALALQFNLSETTFILSSQRANARVRIFTPRYELPFAGHPTLGTAHVCRALGLASDNFKLEMTAGLINVGATGNRWTLQANAPTWREFQGEPTLLASMLELDAQDIGTRPLWVNTGTEQLIVPLRSESAVRRARPRADILMGLGSADRAAMAYVFAIVKPHILARFFFQQGSSALEDPATGSATANLGGWCLALHQPLPWSYEILQGEYVGRPSRLHLRVEASRQILVSGDVIELGSGLVTL